MQAEPFEDRLGVAGEDLELRQRALGPADSHQLDLVELVLAIMPRTSLP